MASHRWRFCGQAYLTPYSKFRTQNHGEISNTLLCVLRTHCEVPSLSGNRRNLTHDKNEGFPFLGIIQPIQNHFAPGPLPSCPSFFSLRSLFKTTRIISRLTPGQSYSISEIAKGAVLRATAALTCAVFDPLPVAIVPTRSSNSLYARIKTPQK